MPDKKASNSPPPSEVVILSGAKNPRISSEEPQVSPEGKEHFHLEPQPIPQDSNPKRPTAEKEEASQSPFSVTVGQVYDGPLDLLLDLIRKQNIDIYDIPIARITSQFLEYTHQLKQVDVDT